MAIVFGILILSAWTGFAVETPPDRFLCHSGAIFDLLEAKVHLQTVCVVYPDRRMAVSEGGVFPDPGTDLRRFRFVSPSGDGDSCIDGTLRISRTAEGGERFAYECVAGRNQQKVELYHSMSFPVSLYAGGKVVADGKEVAFDTTYANRAAPLAGRFRELEFFDREGRARLKIVYSEPTQLVIRDSRLWGAKDLDLRVYFADQRKIGKDERFGLSFDLIAPGGFRESFEKRTVEAGKAWIPARFDKTIEPGSVCDFSKQIGIDAPAGRHGWIIAKGENFVFEDSPNIPRRFYGNNFGWIYPQLPRERIAHLAGELTRNGYNAVRLHYWDISMTEGEKDGTAIPESRLVAFDGFMKEMIDAGIYVATDLFSGRRVPYREVGIDRDGFIEQNEYKELLLCHEPTVRNLERYVQQLLTHRNVYTGRDYAHEPALAWYCFINEGNAGNYLYYYEARHHFLRPEWVKWLRERKAKDPAYAAIPEDLPGNPRTLDLHAAAYRQFLRFLETRFDTRMKAFVRSLGSRALVSSMNSGPNPPSYQLVRHDIYDYVDEHFYIDDPIFERGRTYPTSCTGLNPVADGRAGVPSVIARRLLDHPFTVTEYNYSAPGRFRGAGGLLMGAFASLQNWAGVWRFCFGREPERIEDPNQGSFSWHDTWSDPIMRASEYPFAALFLRGDLAPASERAVAALPRGDLERLHVEPLNLNPAVEFTIEFPWSPLAWCARTGTLVADAASGTDRLTPSYAEAFTLTREAAMARAFPSCRADVLPPIANGAVRIDEKTGTLAIGTPRTCAVFMEQGRMTAGVLSADVGREPATVWAISHDGKPLGTASRILVGHLTNALQAGTTFVGDDVICLLNWGRAGELLVRNAQAEITLDLSPGNCRVWALSSGGRRVAEIPVMRTPSGKLKFVARVDRNPGRATWFYEVERTNDR